MSHPDNRFLSSSLNQALVASSEGDSTAAIALFVRAIEEAPESAKAHFLLGSEYAALGDISRAEHHIGTSLLLSPQWHVARYQLGLLQFSDGRAPAALLTWRALLELEDSSPLPHWVQGFTALARDDFEAARTLFEAGLQRNTDNAAMSADIRRILAAIPESVLPAESADDCVSHVLLSNYLPSGPGH